MCGWEEDTCELVKWTREGRDSRIQKLYNYFKMSEGVINSKERAWAGTLILGELEECGECKDLGTTKA